MTGDTHDRGALPLVLLTLALTIVAAMPLFLTGALAVQMREELGFGVAALGVAVAAFRLVGAVSAPRLGRLVDRVGPVPAMRAALGVSITASLGIAVFARSWGSLVALLAFGGTANSLAQTGANISLARVVRDGRQGIAFAMKQSALPAASAISGLAVPALAIRFGWRSAFIAAAAAATTLLFAVPSTRDVRLKPVTRATASRRATPALLVLTLGLFFAMCAATTLITFTVDSAVAAGVSPASAGLLLTFGSLLAIVTRLVVGFAADRRQRGSLRTVGFLLFGGAVGYLVLALQMAWSLPIGVAIAFSFGWGFNGLFFYAVVRLHREAPGAATGRAMSGGLVGGLVGPTVFGWVVEAASYQIAWAVSALWAAGGGIAMLWGRHLIRRARTTR